MAQIGTPGTLFEIDITKLGEVSGPGGLIGSAIYGHQYSPLTGEINLEETVPIIVTDKIRIPSNISENQTDVIDVYVGILVDTSITGNIYPVVDVNLVYIPTNLVTKVVALPKIDGDVTSGPGGTVPSGPTTTYVETVSGLNIDNTDPVNPFVQISVDGVTITGAGTPGSPLVAVGGGGTVPSGPTPTTNPFAVIDQPFSSGGSGYNLIQGSTFAPDTNARPNTTYYIKDLGSATTGIFLLPSDGSNNGGAVPVVGDRVRLQVGVGFSWAGNFNKRLRVGTQSGATVCLFQPFVSNGYIENTPSTNFLEWYSSVVPLSGLYIEFMCIEDAPIKWVVTTHSWQDNSGLVSVNIAP